MAASLVSLPTRPKKKTWRVWWKGDQGRTSQCVGYAWHGLLRSLPLLQRDPKPAYIYHEAQKVDEWDGEDYDGTSVRAGAKVLQRDGKLQSYGWAWDLDTVLNWLAFKGPVVLGTNWYEGMDSPDRNGLVAVTGGVSGGHAYAVIGYDEQTQRVYCQNSWGTWGLHGRFYLSYADAARLIGEDGEACTALELAVTV